MYFSLFATKFDFLEGWDEQERKRVDGDQAQCSGVTELGGKQLHQILLPSFYRKLLIGFCEKEQRGRRRVRKVRGGK